DLPPELQLSRVRDEVEYSRFHIHGADFVLPRSSDLETAEPIGIVHRNRTTFADCREYLGESTVTFGEPGVLEQPAVPQREPLALPPGMTLELRTAAPIRGGVTALGDRISAIISKGVGGAVPIPKGAAATLRVTRMETDFGLQFIGLQLLNVMVASRQYSIHAA